MHVTYTQQGDEAGNGGEKMAVGTRIQIQAECEKRAGQAGHRDAAVQDSGIRQRLFLARTRGMRQVRDAEKQYGVLAGENQTEQGTRPTELRRLDARRMAGDCDMGMQSGERQTREHHAAGGSGAEQEPAEDRQHPAHPAYEGIKTTEKDNIN